MSAAKRLALVGAFLTACSGGESALDSGMGGADAGVINQDASPDDAQDFDDASIDAGGADASPIDGGGVDTGTMDAGIQLPTVTVGHQRELRGVWVATVSNINFPSRTGMNPEAMRAELDALVAVATDTNLNALVFQIRPEGDALYNSSIEPWSRYLTGSQGQDPGFDPLQYLLDIGHAQGIEIHAWMNPYRARANRNSTLASGHMALDFPEHAHRYGNFTWMDPGAAGVQDRLEAVVVDVVQRYDIDGIHFDDYFYPYPDGTAFPDSATYTAYQNGGGSLDRDDWRRENVNQMVARIGAAVEREKPWVRFGISPFGIYRPGIPPGIRGLDQFAEIYADPPLWIELGWVDYLAPQLYWPSTQTAQAYQPLVEWWSGLAHNGYSVLAGNYLSRLGDNADWSVDEFRTQLAMTRAQQPNATGNIWFHIGPLQENRMGITDVFRSEFYPNIALTPPLATANDAVDIPRVAVNGTTVSIGHNTPNAIRTYVLYAEVNGTLEVQSFLHRSTSQIPLGSGRWAISAVSRAGLESLGVEVDIP